jgi:tight adherence protein C
MELPDPLVTFILTLVVVLLALTVAVALRGAQRTAILRRLWLESPADPAEASSGEEPLGTGLQRWLGLAGYRAPLAAPLFVMACVGACLTGIFVSLLAQATGAFARIGDGLASIPGEFGQVLLPIVGAMPWLIVVLCACAPLLVVRAARRRIVESAERELPVFLELLATLAEAGLGFDAAISEILESDRGTGVLADEFRTFQRETLSGVARVRCLRRVAQRVDVPALSTFVSCLVQAERGGFGLSDVLRVQADDMRNRRKETALMRAHALPVKLVFPLVICFLPALFVLTLGPAFHVFVQHLDAVTVRIGK